MPKLGDLTLAILMDASSVQSTAPSVDKALDNIERSTKKLEKSTTSAGAATGQYNQGLVQLGFALEDATQFQFGFSQGMRAIGNNLIPVISGLGLSASLLGAVAVAVGGAQLAMSLFADDTKEAEENLADLGEQAKITAGLLRGELADDSLQDMKALRDGISQLVTTFDTLSEGINTTNAAQSQAFATTLRAFAEENDLNVERLGLLREILEGLDEEIFKQETLNRLRAELPAKAEEEELTSEQKNKRLSVATLALKTYMEQMRGYKRPAIEILTFNDDLLDSWGMIEAQFIKTTESMRFMKLEQEALDEVWRGGSLVSGALSQSVVDLAFNLGEVTNIFEEFGNIGVGVLQGITRELSNMIAKLLVVQAIGLFSSPVSLSFGGAAEAAIGVLTKGPGFIGSGFGLLGQRSRITSDVLPSGDLHISVTEGAAFQQRYLGDA